MNINKCIDKSFTGNWREHTVDIHTDTIVDINFGKMVVVSNKREEGTGRQTSVICHCYFT